MSYVDERGQGYKYADQASLSTFQLPLFWLAMSWSNSAITLSIWCKVSYVKLFKNRDTYGFNYLKSKLVICIQSTTVSISD